MTAANGSNLINAPQPQVETTNMSILSEVESGLSKATSFLLKVFTKTEQLKQEISTIAPATTAAMLATFYDAVKTVQAGEAAVAAGASGNVPLTITLSENTWTLVKAFAADVKADVAVATADAKTLGL